MSALLTVLEIPVGSAYILFGKEVMMSEKRNISARLLILAIMLLSLMLSCGDSNKTKKACIDYLKKVAECTMNDEETREQYMFENRASCEDVWDGSWKYQKIYPCRKIKDCDGFLLCVTENTSQAPDGDSDISGSEASDGDSSSACTKTCNCSCSCGDSTLTSIEECLDCLTACEAECETYCGD